MSLYHLKTTLVFPERKQCRTITRYLRMLINYRESALTILPAYTSREGVITDYFKAKENFNKVLDTLGSPSHNDLIVNIDLRVKNGYGEWGYLNSICNAIWIKVSQYFWGRKSKHTKFPYVRAIESKVQKSGKVKDHAHMMIKIMDLKQPYTTIEIEDIITKICYNIKEINSKDRKSSNPPVKIRTFPFWEDKYNTLGKRIIYICKDTHINKTTYDPLIKGLHKN